MQQNSWKGNILMPTVFWRIKNQMCYSSGTHFLSKNKDFGNGNSLRMTEQEDNYIVLLHYETMKFGAVK